MKPSSSVMSSHLKSNSFICYQIQFFIISITQKMELHTILKSWSSKSVFSELSFRDLMRLCSPANSLITNQPDSCCTCAKSPGGTLIMCQSIKRLIRVSGRKREQWEHTRGGGGGRRGRQKRTRMVCNHSWPRLNLSLFSSSAELNFCALCVTLLTVVTLFPTYSIK